MSREQYLRGSFAMVMTELLPPILRTAALDDEKFAISLGLVADGVVKFAPSGVSFTRSTLLKAARAASQVNAVAAELNDEEDIAWRLEFDRNDLQPVVRIYSENDTIHVSHIGLVSERVEDRMAILDGETARANLPVSAREHWAEILSRRPLSDEEIGEFSSDTGNTPVAVSASITNAMQGEHAVFDVLVPKSVEYYERLVGPWNGQQNIRDYAEQVLPAFLAGLLAWDQAAGLRLALLLCSHPCVVDLLVASDIGEEAFDRIAQWAAQYGDAMTRCALLELGLRRRSVSEQAKIALSEITTSLSLPEGRADNLLEMLSCLFVFVYGQLSHTKALMDKPTFWRRMAAFAQASLMLRCIRSDHQSMVEFTQELRDVRARPYLLQVYVDMRLGPLWHGHFAQLPQLRNELVGRVVWRASAQEEAANTIGIREEILGDAPSSLKSTLHLYLTQMAGPLEDNIPLVRELDETSKAMIIEQLGESKPTMQSFAGLLNAALLWSLPAEIPDMAAQALERAQYRIEASSNEMFVSVLTGLATCAAVTRSTALADAVFTVIRYYRRIFPNELDLSSALNVGSIACASRSDLAEWSKVMGNLMADLAFQAFSKDEAANLDRYIRELCEFVPELWASCGPALAAAQSVL